MNGIEVFGVIVTAIVSFLGYSAYKIYMNKRAETHQAQMKLEDTKDERASRAVERAEAVRQTVALSQEETKRSEIMASLVRQNPKVDEDGRFSLSDAADVDQPNYVASLAEGSRKAASGHDGTPGCSFGCNPRLDVRLFWSRGRHVWPEA